MVAASASANLTSNQTMSIFDSIEALDRKVTELQTQVCRLEAQLEHERADRNQTREDLRRLKERSVQNSWELPRGIPQR